MTDRKRTTTMAMAIAIALINMVSSIAAESSAYYEHSHPCNRPCDDGSSQPMVCYYRFTIEWYYTLSKACFDCPFNASDCGRPHCIANHGVEKAVLVANRQLPGPSIEVCENDTIIVDVQNHAGSEATAIHWHGIHQVSSPHMDGVPMITQCSVLPHNTFRYEYIATPSGTHFWHSHAGLQRSDGLHGMLVVRQSPTVDPHFHLYDYDSSEHLIMVTDWLSEISFDRFVAHHHQNGSNKPESILVNGKGRLRPFLNKRNNETVYTPIEVLTVTRGKRYRFRMASNGILNCPIQVSIDNHTLAVIATDGQPIEPIKVDSLIIYAGERFDFIVNANQQMDNYLIRLRGLLDCDERFTKAFQVAILRYAGAPPFDNDQLDSLTYADMNRQGKILNPLNSGTTGEDKVSVASLVSLLDEDEATRSAEPDLRFYLPYDFMVVDNKHFHDPSHYPVHSVQRNRQMFTPQINNISFVFPSAPLLSQPDATPSHLFCNHTHTPGGQNCSREFCECIYTLHIPLGSVVELVIIDKGFAFDANHPIHIHGLSFRVIAMERVGHNVTLEQIMQLEAAGKIKRNLKKPVVKDTVTVPDGGYTIIRFVASNPGYWLLHCHIEFHIEVGMGLVLVVGDRKDMKKTPAHFPRCGNWIQDATGSSTTIRPTTSTLWSQSILSIVFVYLTWIRRT